METELIHVGFGNLVAVNRVVAVVSPNSAPIKRLVQESRSEGHIIDMTNGRRTKSVIVTDSGHILLVAISMETIEGRLTAARSGKPIPAEEEDMASE